MSPRASSLERRYAHVLEVRRRDGRDRLVSAAGLLHWLVAAAPFGR